MRPEEQPADQETALSIEPHTFDDDGSGVSCDTCPLPWNHPKHITRRPAVDAPAPVITVNQSATSQAAGEVAAVGSGTLRAQIYHLIASRRQGMTTDDVEVALERSHQSVSSAVYTLARQGHIKALVEDGQEVRRNTRTGTPATVYVAATVRVGIGA